MGAWQLQHEITNAARPLQSPHMSAAFNRPPDDRRSTRETPPYAYSAETQVAKSAYSDSQYAENYPDGIHNYFWHLARNRFVTATLCRAVPGVGRVLEIGCGPGIVLRHLRMSGIECWGCDLGRPPVPAPYAPYVFLLQDCLQLDPEFRSGVDALLLLDVLEHIEDDIGFLRALREAFPNCRALITTVPARNELWSNYDEHYGHFRRYNRAGITTALMGGGFEPKYLRYFFHELYLPMLVARMMPHQRVTAIQPPSYPGLHRLLGFISSTSLRILPQRLPGTSLIAVATRD
jgi:2-polyprenyl-3-methyl-5-hydroxy-6-metoxy-1,4-benzoquinol methylase